MLREIVEFIVMELVEDRESVQILQKLEENKIFISVHVDEKDFGKVIGKGGQTIRSIRSLIATINPEKDKQVLVDISK